MNNRLLKHRVVEDLLCALVYLAVFTLMFLTSPVSGNLPPDPSVKSGSDAAVDQVKLPEGTATSVRPNTKEDESRSDPAVSLKPRPSGAGALFISAPLLTQCYLSSDACSAVMFFGHGLILGTGN